MALLENLKAMDLEQLRAFADTQGVQVHWKAKPETIIKQIIDKVANPVKTDAPKVREEEITQLTAKRLKDAEESAANTPDMIEDAIASIKAKLPEFKSEYNCDENTWTFSYKGATDCGNIAIPMRRILRQAQIVSRGRIAPVGHDPREWGGDIAGGKNAYTNTVLAG